jgi:hypothetical protein
MMLFILSLSVCGSTTLRTTTFTRMILSIMGLFVTLRIYNTYHNETQHNSIECLLTTSVTTIGQNFYDTLMLGVVILSSIMLSVVIGDRLVITFQVTIL